MNWQSLANPARFHRFSDKLLWPLAIATALIMAYGLYCIWFVAPPDYQQGQTVKIMYIHVPAAWLAMLLYVAMAVAALLALVWKHLLAFVFCRAAAPIGAAFTALCLITGSLWGQPMWGAWWVWDARLTSVLILFMLYLGYIALTHAIPDQQRSDRAGAILLLLGVVNIPIIRFSVDWWQTLHQPASVLRLDGPALHSSMLTPLLIMAAAHTLLAGWLVLLRMQSVLTKRQAAAQKLKDILS
jgi:heme exporter protein C